MVQSWDAKRQDDLVKLKTALEHYYQDTGCYPSPELISQCGGDGLEPYLNSMLCDPRSNQPYAYYRSGCHTYRLLTTLEYDSNPAIAQSGCTLGCGADLTGDGQGDFNYGVSSPNVTLAGRPPICILDGVAHCAIVGEGGCCPGNMSCDVDNAWCVFNGAGE